MIVRNCALASAGSLLLAVLPARGEDVLRIAMTASDIPTANGMPNNGFEGMRFLGYPIFEGLALWDLSRADRLADLRPGLATSYEQAPDDKKTWIFWYPPTPYAEQLLVIVVLRRISPQALAAFHWREYCQPDQHEVTKAHGIDCYFDDSDRTLSHRSKSC